MSEQWVELSTPEGPMDAFVVTPEGRGPRPAVLVIQEVYGVNAHIQDVCRRVAGLGYVSLAPELFHRTARHLQVAYDEFSKARPPFAALTNEGLLSDVRIAKEHLQALGAVNPAQTGVIGFCVGGFVSLLAACRGEVQAAVAFYAGGVVRPRPGLALAPFVEDLENLKAPTLVLFGGADSSISASDAAAIEAALDASSAAHEVVTYPGVGHGFFCDARTGYSASAANDAWARARRWFSVHLSSEGEA